MVGLCVAVGDVLSSTLAKPSLTSTSHAYAWAAGEPALCLWLPREALWLLLWALGELHCGGYLPLLDLQRPTLHAVLSLLVAWVVYSRMYIGAHFLSDCLVGYPCRPCRGLWCLPSVPLHPRASPCHGLSCPAGDLSRGDACAGLCALGLYPRHADDGSASHAYPTYGRSFVAHAFLYLIYSTHDADGIMGRCCICLGGELIACG